MNVSDRMLCWWGIWMLCLSPSENGTISSSARRAQLGTIVSPLFTLILLMFASGVPTAEKPQAKKFYLLSHGPDAKLEHHDAWTSYKEYIRSTSVLIPIPPAVYRHIPVFIKRSLLLDFPMYQFDERVDGPGAVEEERRRKDERTETAV